MKNIYEKFEHKKIKLIKNASHSSAKQFHTSGDDTKEVISFFKVRQFDAFLLLFLFWFSLSLRFMPSAAEIASRAALVAGHHGPVAAEARHQDGEEGQADPTSQPVTVGVRALAGVNVVALRVRHAVVQKTFGALQTARRFDGG